jgi:uncharacterized repeat protein (TIGR02059 family)
MKNTLILFFLVLSLSVGATTYYISPTGSDSNTGTSSSPWKTLSYACSKASIPGDIIHINAGTYTETTQSKLAVGVSIEGTGTTSIIHSNITSAATYTIVLSSPSQGTDGNQSISNLRMTSDLDAFGAILVDRRKNVSIHNCTFDNFFSTGVRFSGYTWNADGEPTTYATGNSFHDNIMTNCADYSGTGHSGAGLGNLEIGGQQGMLIYNNNITQTDRGANANGWPIKYANLGFCKGLKIYNNTLIKPPFDGVTWNICVELWNSRGGIEIYGNKIEGMLDFGGNTAIPTDDEGGYGFATKIHNNLFGAATASAKEEEGISPEVAVIGGFYVYNNIFRNLSNGIIMPGQQNDRFEDFYVYYNLFYNMRNIGDNGSAVKFRMISAANNISYKNIYIVNNTMVAATSQAAGYGIIFDFYGSASNIVARNNIIQGYSGNPIYMNATGTINTVSVENNLFYGNGNNTVSYAKSVAGKTEQNNIVNNPLFVSSSDFHLQANSPAIKTGLHLTTPTISSDLDGVPVGGIPEIGSYQYGTAGATAALTIPVLQTSAVANATPTLVELTYSLALSSSAIPAATAYSVLVNTVAIPVTSVAINGSKVQLSLGTAIKYGDIITLSYTKPSSNPLQATTGGVADALSAKSITNNLVASTKDGSVSITMKITPNHVHSTLNVALQYTGTPEQIAALVSETIMVSDASGKPFIEKLIVSGAPAITFPLNLKSGVYTVSILANAVQMTSQKVIVY